MPARLTCKKPLGSARIPRIAFLVTVDWYFYRHYCALASAVCNAGYEVVVISGVDTHSDLIREAGFKLVPLEISRKGMHPLRELATVLRLIRTLRRISPDVLHTIAQKPALYGSIASSLAGVPLLVAALPGLGWLFTSEEWRARLGRRLVIRGYRILLKRPNVRVLVQNSTDRDELTQLAALDAALIPGSGVDLERFAPHSPPAQPITIVLASRLLWVKGIGELVEAARLLRERGVACRCVLVGMPDEGNPASVSSAQLETWQSEGTIEWWGYQENMPAVFRRSHIACLPTYYREGIPKFLLEAAASGLPIVATDMPGCRDAVIAGNNGLLVPPKDAVSLADALQCLITNQELRTSFGRRSRELAEARFGNDRIASETLAVYADLLNSIA
jgi:glycosyltransferase involved in cell wall biosynthesis